MKRRHLLKQGVALAGATAFSPLGALVPQKKRRQKYLFVVEGNGLPQCQIHPSTTPFIPLGKRQTRHEFKLENLPDCLTPIGNYMDKMCIIQGITGKICGGGHSNDHGTLGSYNARDGKLIDGPTIDYLLGAQNESRTFKNVVLGINARNHDVVFNLSAEDKDKPIATICNPRAAYNRMFGALGNKSDIAEDRAMIEYLKNDITDAQRQFRGNEPNLKKYHDSLSSLLERNERIGNLEVSNPPKLSAKYDSEDHVDMLDAHFEMAAAALRLDLTDSATLAVGVGYEHFQIQMASLDGVDGTRHGLGHRNMKGNDPSNMHEGHIMAARVRKYVFQLIARALEEVDDLVVVYTSDAAEVHHSRCDEWPHIIVGNHDNLRLDGRFLYYPETGTDQQRTINALHNSILRAGGIEKDGFGLIANNLPLKAQLGVLPELMA